MEIDRLVQLGSDWAAATPDDPHMIRNYLCRLGLPDDLSDMKATFDLLCQLQYAHVTRIPYENLDILLDKPLPVDWPGLYGKIVVGKRGGYCFELNGAFAWLLRGLGYRVKTCMGRYLRGEQEVPMRRHRVILAECQDGIFVCDAGVGQVSPRHPLSLVEGLVQEQFGERYTLVREPFLGWVIYDEHKGSWRRFYSFTEEEQLDIDFVMPSYYCEHAPDSIFRQGIMMSIKTADGRKTIDGHLFRIFSSEGVYEEELTDLNRMGEIFREEFLIECDLPLDIMGG